ncbi:hypothetical protein [Mesorhizobium sp. M0488]|uniref:hypothetical protein n=1 Tax=unclassified Mesorhizobium TaxID=325217 RepID=UPI00333D7EF5
MNYVVIVETSFEFYLVEEDIANISVISQSDRLAMMPRHRACFHSGADTSAAGKALEFI